MDYRFAGLGRGELGLGDRPDDLDLGSTDKLPYVGFLTKSQQHLIESNMNLHHFVILY